jgi:hypothetical protein
VGTLNQAPSFVAGTYSLTIPAVFGEKTLFNLPAISDPENDTVVIDIVSKPAFVSNLTLSSFEILPSVIADIGNFRFAFNLTDIEPLSQIFNFTITVLDPPPLFVKKPVDQIIRLNVPKIL